MRKGVGGGARGKGRGRISLYDVGVSGTVCAVTQYIATSYRS